MFKTNRQKKLAMFDFPLGELDPFNRWVALEEHIPWDLIDDIYATKFDGKKRGKSAYPCRMAFGALLVQQILSCSDRELISQVAENAYLQYLLGLGAFQLSSPFGASALVDFRKRFSEQDMKTINEAIACRAREAKSDGEDDDRRDQGDVCGGPEREDGAGDDVLIMDATVIPASIRCPQDTSLLFEVREKLESLIDELCAQTGAKHPRTYRRIAKREVQSFSKRKKRSAKAIRSCIRGQLGYVKRDLRYITELRDKDHAELNDSQVGLLSTCTKAYGQRKQMYEEKTHTTSERIVSITQPWVRPIVRGKANAPVEFGAKIHTVIEDDMAPLDALSFDAFNESTLLISTAKGYKARHGRYPSSILADKIYQTRANRAWCKEHGIRLSGPKLGRPAKDGELRKAEQAQLATDTSKRNLIEATFGTLKGSLGLERLSVKLESTTKMVIGMAHIAFNLRKLVRLFHAFIHWLSHITQFRRSTNASQS